MDQILNRRLRRPEAEIFGAQRDYAVYDNTWGAGLYGAFYSPRNNRKSNNDKKELDSRKQAKNVEKAVEGTRDILDDIRISLSTTLKELARSVVRIENKEDRHRGKGTLGAEDRDQVLKTILSNPTFKTKYQTNREQALFDRKELLYKFSKRGVADMLFGVPGEGSARDNGRKYDDALKQYQSDRMMLQGKTLIDTYGSKRAAEKQIAKDFHEQQRTKKEIATVNKEVERRRKAGWEDADIDSKEAGGLLTKLNELTDRYAKFDPTNTGRFLEQAVDPKKKPKDMVLPSERFKVGQAVHKDYVDDVKGKRGISYKEMLWEALNGKRKPTEEGTAKEEADLETQELQKEEMEEVKKQSSLLEKIADALVGKEKVEGYSDGKPDVGFWSKVLAPLSFLATIGSTLTSVLSTLGGLAMDVGKLAVKFLGSAAGAVARGVGVAAGAVTGAGLATAAGAAALVAVPVVGGAYLNHQMTQTEDGVKQRIADREDRIAEKDRLIEADPRNAEKYKKERAELVKSRDEFADRLNDIQMKNVKPTDISKPDAGKGAAVYEASEAAADMKRESARAPVTVVAPATTNNTVTKSDGAKQMGNVRNPDSKIQKYIDTRYAN